MYLFLCTSEFYCIYPEKSNFTIFSNRRFAQKNRDFQKAWKVPCLLAKMAFEKCKKRFQIIHFCMSKEWFRFCSEESSKAGVGWIVTIFLRTAVCFSSKSLSTHNRYYPNACLLEESLDRYYAEFNQPNTKLALLCGFKCFRNQEAEDAA